MASLFPPIKPYNTGYLKTPDGVHELYYEELGYPQGVPVIFLHGGPGSGCNPTMPRFFDPAHFHIILMDQRGCGRSRPLGCLERNTPARLVEDMEQLREHLGLTKWAVVGGSWGCTLALLYACQHADKLTGLCVGGVYLARPAETEWMITGVSAFFPESREKYVAAVPNVGETANSALEAYRKVVFGEDRAAAVAAAHAWGAYEDSFSLLVPPTPRPVKKEEEKRAAAPPGDKGEALVSVHEDDDREMARTKIMLHYLQNDCFLHECFASFHPETHTLLEECAAKLRSLNDDKKVPVCIVQGRYDMVCPPHTAYELHKRALPDARLVLVPDAGHSYGSPSMERAYLEAVGFLKSGMKA